MLHHTSTPDIQVPDIKVLDIKILGEQDGPAEQRLKEALAVLLGLGATVTRGPISRGFAMTTRPVA
jgi:hypothetical protein